MTAKSRPSGTKKKVKQKNNKAQVVFRYGLATLAFVLFGCIIISKLFATTVIEAKQWNDRAKKDFSRVDTIPPERGNILADNGNILACNLKVYDIKADLRHNKILKAKIKQKSIDSLADSLDLYYPRVSNFHMLKGDEAAKNSWHAKLHQEFDRPDDKRKRALRLVKHGTIEDYERIRNWPVFKEFKGRGYRHPLYTEERNVRIYPYGRMAYRSIGRVNEHKNREIHGYSGLEYDLDSLLYGRRGLAKRVALTSGIGSWVTEPAQRGYDIQTTIDIDLQDMLEGQLHEICVEANAEWGTAILMEVETGEIKAIANIQKLENGYGEALNRAVRGFEPGSVMKPISLMIAFEDGLVKNVTDGIDCGPFQRTSDPHAPSYKTMKQVIEMSSNTGIARVIFRGYADDPAKYYDRLASIGFFDRIHSGIAGEEIPKVRKLLPKDSRGNNITMTARHLDLARQAYGYNTAVPPLYTLAIYNAIANKGKFVRPHIMKRLIGNGIDSVLPIDYIREHICSEETAEKVKICLKEPVWGEHGTARAVRDDRVVIAGKTGTAYPVIPHVGYDHSQRRYAFAGFFPYDNPKYSCMALILAPSGTSANRTSGQVVKNMALKMYARGMLDNKSTFTDKTAEEQPLLSGSVKSSVNPLAKGMHLKNVRTIKVEKTTAADQLNATPDVSGYDAPSAVKILESYGYNVKLRGAGRVVAQSRAPGTQIRKGTEIILTLQL